MISKPYIISITVFLLFFFYYFFYRDDIIFYYFYFNKLYNENKNTKKNNKLENIKPKLIKSLKNNKNNENKLKKYLFYKELGFKAEKKGEIREAIINYTLALLYKKDKNLEEKIKKLKKEKDKVLKEVIKYIKIAKNLENKGNFKKANIIYKKIYSNLPSYCKVKIKNNLKYIKIKYKLNNIIKEIKKSIKNGDFNKVLKKLDKIEILLKNSKNLPNYFKFSLKIIKYKYLLKRIIRKIDLYLSEFRIVKAIIFVKKYNYIPFTKYILKYLIKELKKDMVLIPEGECIIGNNKFPDEAPEHKEYVKSFYIDKYEVTLKKFIIFVNSTGYKWKNISKISDLNIPVTNVNWKEANLYSKWAGKRLPTEIEWEKAARGIDGRIYPWGNKFYKGYCNSYEANYKGPVKVGSFSKGISPYGCYDMIGNVLEWTQSDYLPYNYKKNGLYYNSNYKVARGGCWYYKKQALRCSNRYPFLKTIRLYSLGFRCAVDFKKVYSKGNN